MCIEIASSATLPLYEQWNLGLLLSAALSALAALLYGLVRSRLRPADAQEAAAAPAPPLGARDFCLSIFIVLIFSMMHIQSALHLGGTEASPAFAGAAFMTTLFLQLLWVVCYIGIGRVSRDGMRFFRGAGLALAVVALVFVFSTLYTLLGIFHFIVEHTGCPPVQEVISILQREDSGSRLLIILAAVIIAPVGEECCFRGLLYKTLRGAVGMPVAVLLTSLFFAAVHMSLGQTLPLMFFAALLCLLYEYTRSLRFCILAHAVFNSINILVVLLHPEMM